MPIPVLTEVGCLLEREKGARAELEFLRSIRAGQVTMGAAHRCQPEPDGRTSGDLQ
jgi:hypothetical protein